MIILAISVNVAENLLPDILNKIGKQIAMDVGSTKRSVCSAVFKSNNRKQFVAAHLMWGTEYSTSEAIQTEAFKSKTVVICDKENSGKATIFYILFF